MKINRELISGITIAVITLILALVLSLRFGSNRSNPAPAEEPAENTQLIEEEAGTIETITLVQVADHSTPDNCWVVISKKVYNLSGFSQVHPGGQSPIEQSCGSDATQLFSNRNGLGAHPETAFIRLESFYIGDLGE